MTTNHSDDPGCRARHVPLHGPSIACELPRGHRGDHMSPEMEISSGFIGRITWRSTSPGVGVGVPPEIIDSRSYMKGAVDALTLFGRLAIAFLTPTLAELEARRVAAAERSRARRERRRSKRAKGSKRS